MDEGGDGCAYSLTCKTCGILDDLPLEGEPWTECPEDRDPMKPIWIRIQARDTGRRDDRHGRWCDLVEVLAVDSLTIDWIEAYRSCKEIDHPKLSSVAVEPPSPAKRARLIEVRDEMLCALRELERHRDIGPLPASLLPLARGSEGRKKYEGAFGDDLLRYTEPVGLAPRGLAWHEKGPHWPDWGSHPAVSVEGARRREKSEYRALGLDVDDLTAAEREELVMSYGTMVRSVASMSPAASAGVIPGDIIWEVRGTSHYIGAYGVQQPPLGSDRWTDGLFDWEPGSQCALYIVRGGETLRLELRLPTDQELHPDCFRPPRHTVSDLPDLVERLADPTPTESPVNYVGGFHSVGDEALEGIEEVIPRFPLESFTPPEYAKRWTEIGVGAYYEYVRADPANRLRFQEAVREWMLQATPGQRQTWGQQKWIPVPGY